MKISIFISKDSIIFSNNYECLYGKELYYEEFIERNVFIPIGCKEITKKFYSTICRQLKLKGNNNEIL